MKPGKEGFIEDFHYNIYGGDKVKL